MIKNLRPIAFVIASTNHGSMLVNRNDYHTTDSVSFGVGYQLLNYSSFDSGEINLAVNLLITRKKNFGDGVVAIDCGANIGVHTIEWALAMHGWGEVIAFEAQERIYYALAGNIALNNCFNARAIFAAIGSEEGQMLVPCPNYFTPSSFGSLELKNHINNEFIGQAISYSEADCIPTKVMAIDQLDLKRLDFIKIDIEGMEMEALLGAKVSIEKFKPILMIEKIKSNETDIRNFLDQFGYQFFSIGINLLAVHPDDPISKQIKVA
jgi:FkbM family methyltransferase